MSEFYFNRVDTNSVKYEGNFKVDLNGNITFMPATSNLRLRRLNIIRIMNASVLSYLENVMQKVKWMSRDIDIFVVQCKAFTRMVN